MRKTVLAAAALMLTMSTASVAHADDDFDAQVRLRSKLRTYHRSMGITTWISLAATTTIATMRYANVYGFGEPLCAEGRTPILGRTWGCGDGLLYQHAISTTFTTMSYVSARTLAALMPDPYDAAAASPRLRLHRALSWVHLAGMIAMPVLLVATNTTSDPSTREALATTHLIVSYSTFSVVTAAASLMVF